MNLSCTFEKATTALLWGCELNKEKPSWTFKPRKDGEQDCKLLLTMICLGEKAKEEMNLVELLPPAGQEDKKTKPIIIASLRASVLPMVVTTGLEFSPLATFQLRAGSGPVFLSGLESYDTSDLSWEEEEEEEEEEAEEEEEDTDVLEEEAPVRHTKRLAPQKQANLAKKRMEKDEAVRPKDKSPMRKANITPKPKKPGSKK
ncbi:nucleoplasmin-2-like [Talpa occidentalis]|uniref:nucleoplasmin-2-like n=1 Tax=Talpa occidentalis TaxID=50954 RepID=UPI00188DEB91|nr:nucleoplasmin-2-like [Talpa occidentalis]